MKTPTSIPRLQIAVLAVSSAMIFSIAGVAYAQYGGSASGQGSSAGQSGSTGGSSGQAKPKDSSGPAGYGVLDKGVESGKVDQKIRVERNKGTDPSLPPPVKRNEKGKVIEDPNTMQGGSIGPN